MWATTILLFVIYLWVIVEPSKKSKRAPKQKAAEVAERNVVQTLSRRYTWCPQDIHIFVVMWKR